MKHYYWETNERKKSIKFGSRRFNACRLVAWLFFITLRFSLSNETQRAFKKLSRANKKEKEKKTSQEFIVSCDDDMYERSSHTPSVGRCLKGILQHRKEHIRKKKWTSASARWERAAENWRKNFAKVSYIVGAMAGPRSEREAKEWKNKNQ